MEVDPEYDAEELMAEYDELLEELMAKYLKQSDSLLAYYARVIGQPNEYYFYNRHIIVDTLVKHEIYKDDDWFGDDGKLKEYYHTMWTVDAVRIKKVRLRFLRL